MSVRYITNRYCMLLSFIETALFYINLCFTHCSFASIRLREEFSNDLWPDLDIILSEVRSQGKTCVCLFCITWILLMQNSSMPCITTLHFFNLKQIEYPHLTAQISSIIILFIYLLLSLELSTQLRHSDLLSSALHLNVCANIKEISIQTWTRDSLILILLITSRLMWS